MIICRNCGATNIDGSNYCIKCGNNIQQSYDNVNNAPVQNMQPIQQQSMNNKSKNNNKNMIWIVLLMALVIGIVVFLMLNLKTNSSKELNNKSSNNDAEINNNDNASIVSGDLTIATLGYDGQAASVTSAITKYFGKYVKEEKLENAPKIEKNNVAFYASTLTYKTTNRKYVQYDFLRHNDIVKSLLSGAVKLDGAIIVVSATNGFSPMNREHVLILHEIGVPRVVVYIDNCDKVSDDAQIKFVEEEVRDLLDEFGFDRDKTPIIKGSSKKALEEDDDAKQSIKNLMKSVDSWINPLNRNEEKSSGKNFKASIYALSREEGGKSTPFFDNYVYEIDIDGSSSNGAILMGDGIAMLMPGDTTDVTINLDNAIAISKGQYFKIKEYDKVIGVGIITEKLD